MCGPSPARGRGGDVRPPPPRAGEGWGEGGRVPVKVLFVMRAVQVGSQSLETVVWSYAQPLPGFERLRDHVTFYPSKLECFLASVRALRQPGRFYAGWITPELVGPFKGEPG